MTNLEIIGLTLRVVFAGYLLWNGIMHFSKAHLMAIYATRHHIPHPYLVIYLSGLLVIIGAFTIGLGAPIPWTNILFALFLIPVTLVMHAFWRIADPHLRAIARTQFLNNVLLFGGIVFITLQAHAALF